ncbi:aminotransferase class V-fold PLP-dependent enzyme [Streptomyces phaeochromogenes]|uniref:Aminotransferase class V-fold PLP-dependent enzyme n=1 Tax=Streptomyces phaeochromogenes TaxID=1923 RepID=A0ABZ1HNS2_STRPH|nr:FAD-dependent oxidoreductase [Streptomyces phaeochromogenes]WSD19925.1 aminotransferase class V-fold PLP-dependent enzyme [Streptomyces phaeochromogenes]
MSTDTAVPNPPPMPPSPTLDVAALRAATPGMRHAHHMNAAGAALPSAATLAAVTDHLHLESLLGGYEAAEALADRMERVYHSAARLIGAEPQDIALVDSASTAWQRALGALRLKAGDRVLASPSTYVSSALHLLEMRDSHGIVLEVLPADASGQVDLGALETALREPAALVTIAHVPTSSGLVEPVAAVGALAARAGVPLLLDATQSLGQLPVDVQEMRCGIVVATGRKFLRGPRGTGLLYVDPDLRARTRPAAPDVRGAQWSSAYQYEVVPGARRYETWESSHALRLGLGTALDEALDLGVPLIRDHVTELAERLRAGLSGVPGVRRTDPTAAASGIVTFLREDEDPRQTVRDLRATGFRLTTVPASHGQWDLGRRGLERVARASLHVYNSADDVDALVAALTARERRRRGAGEATSETVSRTASGLPSGATPGSPTPTFASPDPGSPTPRSAGPEPGSATPTSADPVPGSATPTSTGPEPASATGTATVPEPASPGPRTAASSRPTGSAGDRADVIVVGAGIHGSSAAWQLAARGASVIHLDRFPMGHTEGSSHGRTRMIRRAYPAEIWDGLVDTAYNAWQELELASGQRLVTTTGGLYARAAGAPGTLRGPGCENVDHARAAELFPGLRLCEGFSAVHDPAAGVIDAQASLTALAALGRAHGVDRRDGCAVLRRRRDGEGVRVDTDQGALRADRLVVCAGPWTGELLPAFAQPLSVVRIVNLHLGSSRRHLLEPPLLGAFSVDVPDVGLLYGIPAFGGAGVKIGLDHGPPEDPSVPAGPVTEAERDRLLGLASRFLPAADGPVEETITCRYTMAPKNRFAVGRLPGEDRVLMAAACSGHGFKFGPALGAALADLAEGKERPDLDFLSPAAMGITDRPGPGAGA